VGSSPISSTRSPSVQLRGYVGVASWPRPGASSYCTHQPQRAMSERTGSTVVEAAGSHAIYVSQPALVAALIEQAASAVSPD
jgi:hypothetical protein